MAFKESTKKYIEIQKPSVHGESTIGVGRGSSYRVAGQRAIADFLKQQSMTNGPREISNITIRNFPRFKGGE